MKSNRLSSNQVRQFNSGTASATKFRRNAVAFGVAMAIASASQANPNGLSVVAGQATAQTIGNLMQITNTPGAILNWQQFNIDVGQTTQFIQQNAASQVFNRVTGGDVSQILGTLQSNGQVFLINPAGVFFGQGAVVDTAGFLASTLAASNTDLLNGHLRFNDSTGTAGGIVNQGTLTTHSGGSIVLLAPSIENSGIVHADGEVLLAAGHSVTIVDMKHPTIGLTVAAKAGEKAVNLGQIISKNASLFSHLVKNSGVVEANGAQLGEGGVIRFIAKGDVLVGGQVLAQSATGQGGEIDITGDRVGVLAGARISADGATGGGTVHVGGGWKGQDQTLANARQTLVQANTQISANATQNGNGGEVVVWADGLTVVDSEVQAKGGALGGNGGRVETSGKESLAVSVAANTSAANGDAGKWLIDPANLTIVSEIPAGGVVLTSNPMAQGGLEFSSDNITTTPTPAESFLLNSTVVSGLESNGLVEIYTTGAQPGEGNLTVAAPVLISQNTASEPSGLNPQLFLEAKGEINIDAAVGLAPGQTAFDGFDLTLSYDIAKPVYVDAPVYLGNSGSLFLSPYDIGTAMPTNTPGLLPIDGVNLLSGMNNAGTSGPLAMNQISVISAIGSDPQTNIPFVVGPNKPVKLNVLGANLAVNSLSLLGNVDTPATDIRVGDQGSLQYNILNAKSLTVEAGSTASTFIPTGLFNSITNLDLLTSNGSVNFNSNAFNRIGSVVANAGTINFGSLNNGSSFGIYNVGNITAASGSTINVLGSDLVYDQALLNGTLNFLSDSSGVISILIATDTDLNGTLNMESGFNFASFQALSMGGNSQLNASAGNFVEFGGMLNSSELAPVIPAKQAGAYVSSTNGQFVAQQGARIVMNGTAAEQQFPQSPSTNFSGFPTNGVILDITGLDGRIDAPVNIVVNGFGNSIQTAPQNPGFNSTSSVSTPITTMQINFANIVVNGGGDGRALRIGETQLFSTTPPPSTEGQLTLAEVPSRTNFVPIVDLDFNGSLLVNSGRVRLEGSNVSTTGGTLNVDGTNSTLIINGKFTSADLFQVNRSNGGRLAAEGFWDNSAVNAENAATAAPLTKGNILVGDDLIVQGGLLTSGGTENTINILPDSFLELRNTEVTTTINVAPTSVVLLASQDENGAAIPGVVLNGANINMGGDAFLIVETDSAGVANLNGTATISSGVQGNLILAGRRLFDSEVTVPAPESMALNVGSGIRLNVTGNASSLPAGLQLFYSQQETGTPPTRPVFLVGQLTPEAVAIAEYEDFNGLSTPVTTVLSGFANPSFVIDGFADSTTAGLQCTTLNFCVKFDVAQTLTYAGMVMTTLGAPNPTLATSGVAFVAGADLSNLQFGIQTPDVIMFMEGLNIVTAGDLISGKRLFNGANSTVRLGANLTNEAIANNIENNGLFELQGSYTLTGLITGSGTLNNSGVLALGNTSGSLIQNSIVNSGTINNTGVYALSNLMSTGAATFSNSGTLNFNNAQYTFGTGGYVQTAGTTVVMPGATLTGNLNINGGALSGFGNITGDLNVLGGRIAPGASPGLMTVSGNLTLDAASVVDIEIQSNGGVQGVDFDCIVVQGTATLGGQLNLIDISGGTLGAGNQYAFLQAGTIGGAFASVSNVNTGLGYTFAPPVVNSTDSFMQLITGTVARADGGTIGTGSTGTGTSSAINQNLDQAFTPPPSSTTSTEPDSGGTTTSAQQTQQEEEAVEAASQSTAGTTVSQQSSDIELKTSQSDPQRASAVCK